MYACWVLVLVILVSYSKYEALLSYAGVKYLVPVVRVFCNVEQFVENSKTRVPRKNNGARCVLNDVQYCTCTMYEYQEQGTYDMNVI